MTREQLKEHCEKQIRACEMWAHSQGERPYGKVYEEHKLILELLEQEPKWIPVSNPKKELPKDRTLWVTIDDDRYAQDKGGYYWQGGLVVTQIYWDMTEWSENIVDYVLAYMDYVEPTPYKVESDVIRDENIYSKY